MESQRRGNHRPSSRNRPLPCPVCKRSVELCRGVLTERPGFFPFCSQRCKLIDLGAWLDAEYRITGVPEADPDAPHGDEPFDSENTSHNTSGNRPKIL